MTAEYTPLSVLRGSARQLWGALSEDGPRDPAASTRALQPNTRTTVASTLPRRPAPNATVGNTANHSTAAPQTTRPSEDTRTCYKCGVYGHIGTNPICAKFKDNTVAFGARVGAQRVPDSYSDADGNAADDELLEAPSGEAEAAEDFGGLWGGAQYEPGADPNKSPDLADLLADAHDEEGGVRVGALRARYFALRILDGTESVDSPDTPEEETSAPSPNPACDLPLQFRHPVPSWMPTGPQPPQEPTLEPNAPPTPSSGYDTRLNEFESRVGQSALSLAQTLELEAISAIGAEEHARTVWRSLIPLRPAVRVNYSPELLRTAAVNLVAETLLFTRELDGFQTYQRDLVGLLARRLAAHDELTRLASLPTSATSLIGEHIALATSLNRQLSADIHHHVEHVDYWMSRVADSQRILNAELVRRMLAREARPRCRASSSPPSIGSTPPPSYPGTPESQRGSSTSDDLWELQDDPSMVLATTLFLDGDAPVEISDSEDESPLSLRANCAVIDTAHGATADSVSMASGPQVPDTYDADVTGDSDSPVAATSDVGIVRIPDVLADDADLDVDRDPVDGEAPRMISRALYRFGDIGAEQVITYLRADGSVFVEYAPLPELHYLNPAFRDQHEAAMETAISERAAELQVPRDQVRRMVTLDACTDWSMGSPVLRHRDGFLDSDPRLLPGTNFHDRVASLGPEHDVVSAAPGFRIQVLASQVAPTPRIEHISNVRRPEKMVGLFDQPKRVKSNMACLAAMAIGSSMAYVLFDTGSTTDSITPDYAQVIGSPRIPLDEQITLQLGCVGSRSKICYGTRAPINFGGVKGYLYMDQVNLDRYDGIIGTPFMNKHGVVLDFARREIRFANGSVLPALSSLEEASVLTDRHPRSRTSPQK
ncbi:hypothetical protein C8R47DRAFT_1227846 [Mycena vitilis]|nr:hypothetical protein C8R47DRAFT_1227846 [Mycena vitilis]